MAPESEEEGETERESERAGQRSSNPLSKSQLGKINLAKSFCTARFTASRVFCHDFDEGLTVAAKSNLCTNKAAPNNGYTARNRGS